MSVPSWAVPGAKVVRVAVSPRTFARTGGLFASYPQIDQVYTIRSVRWSRFYGEYHLLLCEFVNPVRLYCDEASPYESGYSLRVFRPLVSDSDELGIETILYRAKGLKSKAPVRESERA